MFACGWSENEMSAGAVGAGEKEGGEEGEEEIRRKEERMKRAGSFVYVFVFTSPAWAVC